MNNDMYKAIKQDIQTISEKLKIDPQSINILAVSKTHSAEKVNQVLALGINDFGENKVQEAENKLNQINRAGKNFHFIGHLQSNKINKLLTLDPFLIHSIDKLSTAEKLNDACQRINRTQSILIEVNTSGEVSKEGIEPAFLIQLVEKISQLNYLRVMGLMTIGALSDDQGIIRRCFRLLKQLSEEITSLNFAQVEMKYLSMGMSQDYKLALEEGSNLIRLGSILFGNRIYENKEGD